MINVRAVLRVINSRKSNPCSFQIETLHPLLPAWVIQKIFINSSLLLHHIIGPVGLMVKVALMAWKLEFDFRAG